jgi:TetR/AcrR family transcriptional repressor of nem operon
MVGVRQFDEGAVLDRIVNAFWRGGYEATSIDDIVIATGLKRGSLYNAFGDKEAMFLKALDRYAARVTGPLRLALDDDDPKRGLTRFFDAHIERMADCRAPNGCLVVGACVEVGGRGDALGRRVADDLLEAEAGLKATLVRWQMSGRLVSDRDITPLGRYLGTLLRGMAVVHRATGDVAAVQDAARVGLETVDAWVSRT